MARRMAFACLIVLAAPAASLLAQAPLGTAITYQGQLKNNGSPANGNFNMQFRLYDAPTAGNQVGSTIAMSAVPVVEGLFTAELDFGSSAYVGNQLWLEVTVSGTPLSPRQKLTAAPFARYAARPWTTSGTSLSYSGGNVGIGTTAPEAGLHVAGSGAVNVFAGTGSPFGIAGFETHFTSPQTHIWCAENNVRAFSVTGGGDAYFKGSVGVGVDDALPTNQLSVASGLTVDHFGLGNSASGLTYGIRLGNESSGEGIASIRTAGTNQNGLDFYTNNSARLSITNAGNVGIGTSAPEKKLSVGDAGTPDSEGMIRLTSRSGTGSAGRVWDIGVPETDEDLVSGYSFVIDDVAAGTGPEFTVKYSSGNVGIGTIWPFRKLTVGDLDTPDSEGMLRLNSRSGTGTSGSVWDVGVPETDEDLSGTGYSFVINDVENGTPPEFTIKVGSGNVGIGTTAPGKKLSVGDDNVPNSEGMIRLSSRSGTGLASRVWDIGVPETDEDVSGAGYSFIIDDLATGTVPEFTIKYGSGNVGIGTANPAAKLHVVGTTRTQVLEITGGADIAEPFNVNAHSAAGASRPNNASIKAGMVVCIDAERNGELRLGTKAYDRTVAGVISGAGGVNPGMTLRQELSAADGKHPVALTGRVYCWVDADAGGPVKAGDMLTTSDTPGHAMKVTDHARAQGAVLGKAMSSLSSGQGLVLVLVTLQ